MKKNYLLLAVVIALFGLMSCNPGGTGNSTPSNTTGSDSTDSTQTLANPFAGHTYKELQPGRDEKDYFVFNDTTVWWADVDYKYEFTETTFTLKSKVNGQTVYIVDYSFNDDKTVLYIGPSESSKLKISTGEYTLQ